MSSTALLVTSTLGWVGAVGTIGAYGLVAQGRLDARSTRFHLLNVLGGGMLAISAGSHANWPSAASNVLWTVLGLFALFNARHVVAAALLRWSRRLRPVSARRPGPVDIVDRAEATESTGATAPAETLESDAAAPETAGTWAWDDAQHVTWDDSRDDTGTIPVVV